MATDLENGRPNIRIEIKNPAAEPMDIDQNDKSEEEGEIRDTLSHGHTYMNDRESAGINKKTRMDIFMNEVDQKKLEERAKRFALKPEDIKIFTEQELHNLYTSLGITSDNSDQVRYEAIHLRSSNQINVENIIAYFREFSPTTVELVDENSCNIVWEDKLCTARVLFYISQVVKGMPVRVASEHIIDSFIMDENDTIQDSSLLNENRQIELRDDNTEEFNKLSMENAVDISVINIPIPPGYWRLGRKPINSYSVLLRFSLKIDKKPYRVEKCSKFYKGGSLNKNSEQKYRGIFARNKDINREVSDKNPWGILAKNWDEDFKFREREHFSHVEPIEHMLPIPLPENPELRVRLAAKRRLGIKQDQDELKQTPVSEKEQSDESEQENERKNIKMPRMRMYADEEEEKIKRRKLLQTLKKQTEELKKTEIPNSDLRNILRITNRKPKLNIEHDENLDLSVSLKNRSRKLVFTVAQESDHPRTAKHQVRNTSAKSRLRPVSPVDRKPKSPIRFERKSSEKYKDWSNRELHSNRERRRSPARKQERRHSDRRYSGRMYSSRGASEEKYYIQKPKSKVALVIKTQKKPSVASAIQSRRRKFETSSSSSEEDSSSEESDSDSSDDSEESSSSSSDDSDSGSSGRQRHQLQTKRLSKLPLKVEIENDQYKRK